jgi:hypothetical protein
MNPIIKAILKDVSLRTNVPLVVVERIYKHQFEFTVKAMGEGVKNSADSFKTINLTHLGKFAPREYVLKQYEEKANGNRTEDTE